jgi:hypothetical protein
MIDRPLNDRGDFSAADFYRYDNYQSQAVVCESVSLQKIVKRYAGLLNCSRQLWAGKATLEIQRGKQTISYKITVSEKQDLQERLAKRVTREQAKIPQLGILALTLDEKLMPMLPPLRNRFGVVVAGKIPEL